jgi:flavin-dependent dehydrogenase
MSHAIESGILAAKSIIENKDYEKLVKAIAVHLKKKYEYRKVLSTFNNHDYDKIIRIMGKPIVKQLIYRNPLAKITQGSPLANAFYKLYRTPK